MRVIQFRAWSASEKEMVEWPHLLHDPDDWLLGLLDDPGEDVLMQFTGFHDPEGAEIYERDIVYIAKAKEHREIRFSDGGFRIFASDGDSWPMNQERASGLMVAGNVFENPELLTA